jgi:predicted RNA-binding Zn ribbon-like protein
MEKRLPPAMFIAGALGLDFLNSVATPVRDIVEWIGTGADFLSWMEQADLLKGPDLKTIKVNMSAAQLDNVAREARELREWFREFVHAHRGRPLKARALDQLGPLKRLLSQDAMHWQIEPAGASPFHHEKHGSSPHIFQLRPGRRWRNPESLLHPIAEEMAKLICSADFTYIKACEGKVCSLLFLDDTRRHGRRWCSMAVCGNRAKAAAFTARKKAVRKKKQSRSKSRGD